jgi:hypothetical protein
MNRKFFNTLVICCTIASAGCTYTETLHTSIYHGTDDHAGLSDFYYLQYGVSGSASASYNFRGGGYVREGLLAEAKRNLMRQYPLGPNQAYSNVAIDDLHTRSGLQTTEGPTTSTVVITVVVSADIIQYGIPPTNYELPGENSNGSLSLPSSQQLPVSQYSDLSSSEYKTYEKGDTVQVSVDGNLLEGIVTQKFSDSRGTEYKIQYEVNGKKKSKFFSGKYVSGVRDE